MGPREPPAELTAETRVADGVTDPLRSKSHRGTAVGLSLDQLGWVHEKADIAIESRDVERPERWLDDCGGYNSDDGQA